MYKNLFDDAAAIMNMLVYAGVHRTDVIVYGR